MFIRLKQTQALKWECMAHILQYYYRSSHRPDLMRIPLHCKIRQVLSETKTIVPSPICYWMETIVFTGRWELQQKLSQELLNTPFAARPT